MRRFAQANIVLLSGLLMSCASIDGPALGDGVTISPGWTKLKQRLMQTVQQPAFWAPLATAAVLQVDDQDERLAERIADQQLVFGSTRRARKASNDLRDLTTLSYIATAVAAPVSRNANWLSSKSKILLTELAGVEATHTMTSWLKSNTDRLRPDLSNRRSFPSGHTSRATVQARLAIINTAYLPLQENTRMTMNIGFNSLAVATGWARIEAERHYPADVLAGWSLGYLVSELTGVFIEAGTRQRYSAQILKDSWQLSFYQSF